MITKEEALAKYVEAVNQHTESLSRLKAAQEEFKKSADSLAISEEKIKALQVVGHQIAEILKKLDDEKYIVKSSQGPRYIVGIKKQAKEDIERLLTGRRLLEEEKQFNERQLKSLNTFLQKETKTKDLNMRFSGDTEDEKPEVITERKSDEFLIGQRVALDITTLTIMKLLPREVDPTVYKMLQESITNVTFNQIGGLSEQIRDLKECIELPLKNPEIFKRVGVKPPKGVLLYGPPGTGKTLLCRALAASLDVPFLKVVASAIIEKYIGESARMIREMFEHARASQPCIIFIDEIDAIGGSRSTDSTSSDREVQRTMMELLAQMDGFKELDQVKIIMATNRPDILDRALMRPGRIDRKIEIGLPNETGRREILKIHSKKMKNEGLDDNLMDILVDLSNDFNGADLRNVCTEAGMFAIRDERDYVVKDDFVKAVRKIGDAKKLESRMEYKKKN